MAALSTQGFTSLVRNMVASIQAGASTLINLNVGSALLAVVEAVAGVVLWLQALVVYTLTLTRAATSEDNDLDTWMADYDFYRELAKSATGQVTFSRLTNTAQALVPFNSVVQTSDGTQQFTVITDPTNAAYNLALGGYVVAPGTTSITLSVTAVNAGTQGNVLANSITSISGSIPGIDSVNNAAAFTNGIDKEGNDAFRARFVLYINSLSRGTKLAIAAAIQNVQQGLFYTLAENADYSGAYDEGMFTVIVDDGTGYPSGTLLASVSNAIDAVRGLTTRFGVYAPTVVTATPIMILTTGAGYVHATVVGFVATALASFINTLPLGTSLPYTQLAGIAYSVAGVTNVTGVLLNSGTSDLVATPQQVIKCGTPVVS